VTFAEFKRILKKYNLANKDASDKEIEYVYRTWSVKTFCTDINSKHLTFTRDNDLHLYSMTQDEFINLLNMNMELLKYYKCEQKIIKMNEDFI
jgi:hypothetical protein